MKTLFKSAILLQSLFTGVFALLTFISINNALLFSISFGLFVGSLFIFGVISYYMQHNDLFKSISELRKERNLYVEAKNKYLNAQIDKIEKQ